MLDYLAQHKCQVHLQFGCYVCTPAPAHNLPLCRMVGSNKSHRILQAYDWLVLLAVVQLDLLIRYIIIIHLLFGQYISKNTHTEDHFFIMLIPLFSQKHPDDATGLEVARQR